MWQNSWITSTDLLFRPTIVQENLLEVIEEHLKKGDIPLIAISYCINNIMAAHTKRNLKPNLDILHDIYKTTADDLTMLQLGYLFVTSTIMVTVSSNDKTGISQVLHANLLIIDNEDVDAQKVQNAILDNLKSTINLYRLDDSGALMIQFLFDYPPIQNEYFEAGMQMAAIIIFGLINDIQRLHPDLNWPSPTQNYNIST